MMVLDWYFDCDTKRLWCPIGDDLVYEALEGGTKGYKKFYKGVESFIRPDGQGSNEWRREKWWISANYSDIVGVHEENYENPIIVERTPGRQEVCVNGIGPDGRYLDHLQRPQALLEGEDLARVFLSDSTLFSTPDNGKTIYRADPTRDTNYESMSNPNVWWTDIGQPCMMQPRTPGRKLSSHFEMRTFGVPQWIVEQCERGEWESPPRPDLQRFYKYPTK
jgi:hypothetical protein